MIITIIYKILYYNNNNNKNYHYYIIYIYILLLLKIPYMDLTRSTMVSAWCLKFVPPKGHLLEICGLNQVVGTADVFAT